MRSFPLLVTLSLSLVGCVGGIDTMPQPGTPDASTGGTASAGKMMFEASVKSLVLTACQSCHTGEATTSNAFLGPTPATTAYDSVTKDRLIVGDFVTAQARLLTKGAHSGSRWWTDPEKTTITNWILQEATDRGITQTPPTTPGAGPSTTSVMAMQKFAGCMATGDTEWKAGPSYAVANINTGQGRCTACHNNGAGGAYLSADNTYLTMYAKAQEQLYFTALFSTKAIAGSPTTYQVIANDAKLCAKGKEKNEGTGYHPSYDCNNNGSIDKLKTFVDAINAKLTAGACGTPGFKSPT